ncbi:MAG: dephospho-CoA kinase [Frankiaceae bacterium]|nr:dephospho-CoA kinase [Frankiaceae bacterium]MDQ1714106.1 dephospho-CoA kinase [Frankiaceae bacterium]
MLTVGLTGGIGAGKSVVARRLASYGAIVIDTDHLAREVVEPGTHGHAQIVAQFGPRVIAEDGTIDRAELATVVFSDPNALEHLNAIVHPLVAARAAELTAQGPGDAIVVHEVPLLVEIGWQDRYDVVVVVKTSPDIAVGRIVEARGMSNDDAWARANTQAGDEERVAVADYVISNDGDEAQLEAAVGELWASLRLRSRGAAG